MLQIFKKFHKKKRLFPWSRGRSQPFLFAFASATFVLFFGTFGYWFLEGWSFVDALYMTVITLTTVGFGEVHPLDHNGKLFTAFLIVAGVGIVDECLANAVMVVSQSLICFSKCLPGRRASSLEAPE